MIQKFMKAYEGGERFVVFDVETVGTGDGMYIVEIGAVEAGKLQGPPKTFQKILRYRPDSWQPYWRAMNVHKIPAKTIENGAPRLEVLEKFLEFIKGATLICHTSYDIRAMNIALKRNPTLTHHLQSPIWLNYIDSHKLAKKFNPSLKKYSLTFLSEHLGITNANAHRALDDAITTKKMVARMAYSYLKEQQR